MEAGACILNLQVILLLKVLNDVLRVTLFYKQDKESESWLEICPAHLLYPVMRMVAGSGSLIASMNCSNSPSGTRPCSL